MIPRRVLPQQVTIRPLTGSGAYGPTYGPAVTVNARVDTTLKLVRNKSGQEVVASATVILLPTIDVPIGSVVKLPGSTGEREVITSSLVIGAKKAHHLVITTT